MANANEVTLTGKVKTIFPTENGKFRKRFLWLESTLTRYAETWQLIAISDAMIAELDKFKEGDAVECQVTIKGRFWRDRNKAQDFVFNSLEVTMIKKKN